MIPAGRTSDDAHTGQSRDVPPNGPYQPGGISTEATGGYEHISLQAHSVTGAWRYLYQAARGLVRVIVVSAAQKVYWRRAHS